MQLSTLIGAAKESMKETGLYGTVTT